MPEATQKMLERFVSFGGKVLRSLSELTPVVKIDGEGLRAMHRKTDDGEIFFLFREKGDSDEYKIYLPSSNGYLLDLINGTLQKLETYNNVLQLSIAIGETAVVLLTDEAFDAELKKKLNNKFHIKNDFQFYKDIELSCDGNGFTKTKHTDKAIPIQLGDWSYLIGEAYSGSGVYEAVFTISEEKVGKEGCIDLGDVHYTAEVFLNDEPLGVSLMPPYRFNVPKELLKKENKLKVIVTNTSANWYAHTEYFDSWKIEELSPYFEVELEFAKSVVSGGLYGPITLYTE